MKQNEADQPPVPKQKAGAVAKQKQEMKLTERRALIIPL